MALRDIVIPTKTIEVFDSSFEVRAISMPDLMEAIQDFGPAMASAFDKFQSGELEAITTPQVIQYAVREFPDLATAVICLASDSYDQETMQKVRRFPIPVQVEALESVFSMTFRSEADVKKLLESLTRMVTAGAGILENKTPPLGNGTGVSDAA